MANWSKNVIGKFKFGEWMFHTQVLHLTSLIIGTHDIIKKSVCYSERVSQGINKSKLDSTASAMEMFQIESCGRGYHIYKDIWNPPSGEEWTCSHEIENTKDPFAVAMKRRTTIVDHVPCKMSAACVLFIARKGTISCTITGSCCFSADKL